MTQENPEPLVICVNMIQMEVICGNVLSNFGLDHDGSEIMQV